MVHQDCGTYVVALLLLQNIMGKTVDTTRLVKMAGERGVREILITLMSEFNRISGDDLVSLEAAAVSETRKSLDPHRLSDIIDAAGNAFNTLMEG